MISAANTGADPVFGREPPAVTRKKALLRMLCVDAAARSGVSPSAAEFADFCSAFRCAFAIDAESHLEAWLRQSGLERAEFERLLFELCLQGLIEKQMASRVDRELTSQSAIWTLHAWAQAEGER